MQVYNIKLHGNLSNESHLDTSGQTDGHKVNWRLWDYIWAHKILLSQPRRKSSKATFLLRRINGVKQQTLFCYLPLGVPKDICTCQLHVILSPKTP